MKYDDIIALARAGYSREQIEAMDAQTAKPAPAAPAPAPKPAPTAPAPKPEPTEPVTGLPAPKSIDDAMLQQLLGGITGLTEALQASNRRNITGTTTAAPASGIDAVRSATARLMGIEEEE